MKVLEKSEFIDNNKLSNNLLAFLIIINFAIHGCLYNYFQKINRKQAFNYSYNIHSTICHILISCFSYYAYHSGEMSALSYSVETRVFESCHALKNVSYVFLSYDIYSTFISIYLKNWIMCAHHIGTISVLYYGFTNNLLNYYGLFYVGMTCFSSIFICIIDIFKNNKELIPQYPNIYIVSRLMFVISFVYLRIFLWNIYNLSLYSDILYIYRQEDYYHLQNIMIGYFISNILFTILQIYWGYKIINGFIKYLKKNV